MNRYLVFFFLTAICMAGLPTPPALPADDAEKDVLIDTPEEAAWQKTIRISPALELSGSF